MVAGLATASSIASCAVAPPARSDPVAGLADAAAIVHRYRASWAELGSHVQSTAVPDPAPLATELPLPSAIDTVQGSGFERRARNRTTSSSRATAGSKIFGCPIAEAAAATRDAELLVERLAERKVLEKEVEGLGRQARVYQSLAGELRRDRLINFLQGEALELLAEAGSERLLFLSQDRYRLVFEEDEFYVEDRQNGDERRSVRTLSGGETFLASLALALALAEQIPSVAVTQRSRLQSLFIDEGFGALDPESLEVATEALSRLGGQDRMVGVITHVSELAEKMPVRVVVEKLPTGSRLEVVA